MERALPELMLPGRHKDGLWNANQVARFCYGLSESLLGKNRARELGYPQTLWRFGAPLLMRGVLWPTELLRLLIPGVTAFVAGKATRALQSTIERNLAGRSAKFDMPRRVGSVGEMKSENRSDGHDR